MEEDSSDCGGAGQPGGGGGGGGVPRQSPKVSTQKGKSCKGCLYYSSLRKSKSRNPLCVGINRTLQQVPGYIVGESEMEVSKEGRDLSDFKYACVGYSVFLDNRDNTSDKRENRAELPFCVGLEILENKRSSTAGHAHVHNKEDVPVHSPPRAYKPPHSSGEEFLSRFSRNASLVASGVARNLYRVGHHIKDSLDDIMYRRPK